MSLLSEFFLSTSPSIVQLDCLEIQHADFSQTYRLVRNAASGVSVTHEGPDGPYDYTYCPMTVTPIGTSTDLSQSLAVTLGDVGEILRAEIANITAANGMNTRPTLTFRVYRSDALTGPIFGPVVLEMSKITCSADGASFQAVAPELNASRNGETYTVEKFPMLIGLI
jgi:hypothetical protein